MSGQMTLQQQLESAVLHHRAGRLAEAERIYRQVLAQQPDHADALHLLGVLAGQTGRSDLAVELLRRAITICSTNALYYGNLGKALKDVGQLDEALAAYRQAVRLKPDHAEAQYNLGIALQAKGRLDEAIAAYRQAIRLKPDYAEAHNDLGNALKDKGQLDEAIASYRQAVRVRPDFAAAHSNLGNALQSKGQFDEAITSHRQAIRLKPDFADAHNNLGNVLTATGQLDEAVASYRQAIRLNADYAVAHSNLGSVLKDMGQLDEAIGACRQAIRLKPDLAEAHCNLGAALKDNGQLDEALASYRHAIRLKPDLAEAHYNAGIVLQRRERLDEAIAAYRQAIRLKPDLAEAHGNLGNALGAMGQLDEAVASYRQAICLSPDDAGLHSNLASTLHYHPGYDARMIHEEVRRWSQQHAEPLKKFIQPHTNNRDPERRLRIGYVSTDFFDHASAFFLLPLFRHHDGRQVEVFCYALRANSDRVTQQMKDHVQHWRSAVGRPDAKVAAQVREDQIDILVDLKLHTGGNHLLIFAQKPAPVQVTWLGCPGTTGLDTMDYRLADPYLDPPGLDDAYYSERSIRLPDTFWCYDPLTNEPAVNAPPSLEKGFVTFGCLNNFCKINDAVLTMWARVLKAVFNSRLLLLAPEGSSRQRVQDRLGREGISPERVEFVAKQSRSKYLNTYHRIDIGLDTPTRLILTS